MGELIKENKMCTLIRGKMSPEFIHIHQLQEILLDDRIQECFKLAAIRRLCELATERDYSGIFYRVIFRTNCSINVHGLGFWGPQEKDVADYRVKIRISQLSSLNVAKQESTLVTEFGRIVPARRRQIFFVRLERPIHVEVGRWTQIEFSLNGPPTAQCEDVWYNCEGDEGVNFNFANSSRQLPVIKFKIAD